MPIDIDKLMAFKIPVGQQELKANAIALYALSIGLGRNPTDLDQLRYADPLQGPEVWPSMVLVMAHPGFWMADPQSGIDPSRVLHASQKFDILGDLPNSGEVSSHTRVAEVVDKGVGSAALVRTETQLLDATGGTFAVLDRVTYVREGGGFGGADTGAISRQTISETPPDYTIDLNTDPSQALLYRLNGDLNPLHSDPALAAKMGFHAPILHGLCTMGVVSHAVVTALAEYKAARLKSLDLRFSAPVYPGETIRTEIWKEGHFRALVAERQSVVVDNGFAEVRQLRTQEA